MEQQNRISFEKLRRQQTQYYGLRLSNAQKHYEVVSSSLSCSGCRASPDWARRCGPAAWRSCRSSRPRTPPASAWPPAQQTPPPGCQPPARGPAPANTCASPRPSSSGGGWVRTEAAAAALKRLSRHCGRGGSMLPAGLSFPEAGAGAASPGSLAQAGPDCVSRHIVVVR